MPKTRLVRTLASVGVGAALALGSTVALAPDAVADTNGCVTKTEFKKIHKGMKRTRVHRIFDTNGKQYYTYWIGGVHYSGREYRACKNPKWSLLSVDYKNGKVVGKFAYWG